jgi:hypothetical protein
VLFGVTCPADWYYIFAVLLVISAMMVVVVCWTVAAYALQAAGRWHLAAIDELADAIPSEELFPLGRVSFAAAHGGFHACLSAFGLAIPL